MDKDFPGKETHCRHVFFFLSLSLSGALRRTTQWWAKLPMQENTRDKNGKTAKCAEGQDSESTYSFQNCDPRQVFCIQMFSHQGWYLHKERETSFLTLCMVNFDLTATSIFKLWTPAWSSASTSRFHKGIFFSFLDRLVLFLSSLSLFYFFIFFTNDFLPLMIFHEQRFFLKKDAFTCEICKVRDVNKIWK